MEKMVTLAKVGSLAARRKVMGNLDNAREATDILFQKVVKAFPGKTSGFTRIISLPRRVGDNAQLVRLEWTEKMVESEKVKVKSDKTKTKKEIERAVKKVEKGKEKAS